MPIPLIYVAGAAIAAGGAAAYKYYKSKKGERTHGSAGSEAPPKPEVSLGGFAIWGRPDSGKTTFIGQLLEKKVSPLEKSASLANRLYKNVPVKEIGEDRYRITQVADMPGTKDRLGDWLDLVAEKDNHVFYLVDLSRIDQTGYLSEVMYDLKKTYESVLNSKYSRKKIHIVGSHLDESKWKNDDAARVNNAVIADSDFRRLYESAGGADANGYVYVANLTDRQEFDRILRGIINDIKGKNA